MTTINYDYVPPFSRSNIGARNGVRPPIRSSPVLTLPQGTNPSGSVPLTHTASTLVTPANRGRKALWISNTSLNELVYLSLGGTALAGSGITLLTGGGRVKIPGSIYTGAVSAICSNLSTGTAILSYAESGDSTSAAGANDLLLNRRTSTDIVAANPNRGRLRIFNLAGVEAVFLGLDDNDALVDFGPMINPNGDDWECTGDEYTGPVSGICTNFGPGFAQISFEESGGNAAVAKTPNSSVLVNSSTSTAVVPANAARIGLWVCNNSNIVSFLNLGGTAAAPLGLLLTAGDTWFLDGADYKGAVSGICTSSTVELSFSEV